MRCLTTIACLLCLATADATEPAFLRLDVDDDPAPSFATFQEDFEDFSPEPPLDELVCGGGPTNCWWVRGDYLLWWTDGLRTPPLATTSPNATAQAAAGVLDQGATTLFGGDLLTASRSGGRIRFGTWLGAGRCIGVEGEYFALGDINDNFAATSTGDPIITRPFFNALSNA
ncbi:MAG: BBP7 family outer membrane beta-barrel protein, partial [Planctomycetota bacterium]|nr:BBP7 family outer membrane beta-barrel protein [Planctomycetota bacterium]